MRIEITVKSEASPTIAAIFADLIKKYPPASPMRLVTDHDDEDRSPMKQEDQ